MNLVREDTYARLKLASYGLSKIFGLNVIRWYPSERLEPYIVYIMEYIEKHMILSGATTLKQKIDEFDSLYHEIMDKLIDGEIFDLMVSMGISNCPCDNLDFDMIFSENLFVTSLSNFITSLYIQLRYNYSHLYLSPQKDCHVCSGTTEYRDIDYSIPDPRPMNDGYEFGCGTQELWGPGRSNI